MAAGVRAFVLIGSALRGEQMAAVFVKALPRIERFVAENQAPFIARVNKRGQVTLLVAE